MPDLDSLMGVERLGRGIVLCGSRDLLPGSTTRAYQLRFLDGASTRPAKRHCNPSTSRMNRRGLEGLPPRRVESMVIRMPPDGVSALLLALES